MITKTIIQFLFITITICFINYAKINITKIIENKLASNDFLNRMLHYEYS